MKLIKANYTILTPIDGEEILKQIELAARSCYQSEGKIEYIPVPIFNDKGIEVETRDYAKSARTLISKLISLKHEAMLEFGGMITVRFIVDRGVSHELVRHRIASFAQESTRYCNYGNQKDVVFVIPINNLYEDDVKHEFEDDLANNKIQQSKCRAAWAEWLKVIGYTERCYQHFTDSGIYGITPQIARSILPNALKTEINVSANIREWRHIFKLRIAKTAHPQMREVMCPLLDEFKSRIPILFDDITY